MSDKPEDGVAVKVRDVPDRHKDGIAVAVAAPKTTVKKAAAKTGQSAETQKEK